MSDDIGKHPPMAELNVISLCAYRKARFTVRVTADGWCTLVTYGQDRVALVPTAVTELAETCNDALHEFGSWECGLSELTVRSFTKEHYVLEGHGWTAWMNHAQFVELAEALARRVAELRGKVEVLG